MDKKDGKLVTALIVCAIIALAAVGFIVYERVVLFDKKEETKVECNSQTNAEKTTQVESNYEVLELSPISGHAVLYNKEVYVNVYDSTANIDAVYGNGKFQTLIKTRNSYETYDFGKLKVSTRYVNVSGSPRWLKLNSKNIKAIYNNEYGQALSPTNPKYGIIMVDENNEASYISIKSLIDGESTTTKLDIKNVSNVVTEMNNGATTYFVDINGVKTNVNDYIK